MTHPTALTKGPDPVVAELIERLLKDAEQTIDRYEAAMIAERKEQYGDQFRATQEGDIKASHRLMRQGVGIVRAALTNGETANARS